jgi:hypothetical protein
LLVTLSTVSACSSTREPQEKTHTQPASTGHHI